MELEQCDICDQVFKRCSNRISLARFGNNKGNNRNYFLITVRQYVRHTIYGADEKTPLTPAVDNFSARITNTQVKMFPINLTKEKLDSGRNI